MKQVIYFLFVKQNLKIETRAPPRGAPISFQISPSS